ncbi:acyl-CoA N-acyltransferase [Xylariaceae sp. FL0662B]|nr:acyl-CoA N-acyltransferase [Xylariaceae sp. FL0662B]
MAPQKRKRPHDMATEASSQTQAAAPTRRATRQHPAEPDRQLRSGRVRANIVERPATTHVGTVVARGKRDDAPKTAAAPPSSVVPVKPTRTTRHAAHITATTTDTAPDTALREITQPSPPPRIKNTHPKHTLQPPRSPPSPAPTARRPISPSQSRVPPRKPPQQAPRPTTTNITPKRAVLDKPSKPPPTPRSDRNIDKVVLGNICFKAWYPSYYGKDVLNGDGSSSGGAGAKDLSNNSNSNSNSKIGGGKRGEPPMLDRLYVCPCCFKYSKELVLWWGHVRCCERRGEVPGRKVYTHPKGTRTVRVPGIVPAVDPPVALAPGRGKGKKRNDTSGGGGGGVGVLAVEETVRDDGEWSVWEVDGEKDVLFCQNLSLFAKLFLDNKSVFFDVTGFNYFLLVYTPAGAHPPGETGPAPSPSTSPTNTTTIATTAITNNSHILQSPPAATQPLPFPGRPQIVGFFSKEKMSWDNNNLACILVFPPWQRKGLGALLMGVSYAISRREGILGGPEKPISELGRRGYKRFWAGEIARWLLSLELAPPSLPASGTGDGDGDGDGNVDGDVGGGAGGVENGDGGGGGDGKETLVDIETCSRATWIVPEDCLATLRDMGVVEDAGLGPADVRNKRTDTVGGTDEDEDEDVIGEDQSQTQTQGPVDHKKETKLIPRVRVDRAAVRRWVRANRVDLTLTCDPDGFIDGYAVRAGEDRGMDEG